MIKRLFILFLCFICISLYGQRKRYTGWSGSVGLGTLFAFDSKSTLSLTRDNDESRLNYGGILLKTDIDYSLMPSFLVGFSAHLYRTSYGMNPNDKPNGESLTAAFIGVTPTYRYKFYKIWFQVKLTAGVCYAINNIEVLDYSFGVSPERFEVRDTYSTPAIGGSFKMNFPINKSIRVGIEEGIFHAMPKKLYELSAAINSEARSSPESIKVIPPTYEKYAALSGISFLLSIQYAF